MTHGVVGSTAATTTATVVVVVVTHTETEGTVGTGMNQRLKK